MLIGIEALNEASKTSFDFLNKTSGIKTLPVDPVFSSLVVNVIKKCQS